ncbi:MAG: EamA-like protein transporter family [Candidatus Moranbacteria bacterium GW2011_GWE1_35_17]|nr:MAG: EamA-like protein transporter family [Candidatus Moranbacteria bacterium GW2011_GWE1_35_17]KKP89560.1 MAG: EamA-like protein transporter family [Parcubacteria group bacterium GW2011_GWC1_36_108]HCU01671.1 hypothetical protein [Candidatus Nomurabacteria bacterium]
MAYLYILGTIIFTVYGQLILKWRIPFYGSLPASFFDKILFLFKLLLDPFIFSGFAAAFIASFFWMAAVTNKIELSRAYPMTTIGLVLVFVFSIIFFKEALTVYKVIGMFLIISGVLFISKSL